MDINSLLSPQESPVSETPPSTVSPQPSPHRRPGRPKRKSSSLSQQISQSSPNLVAQGNNSLPAIAAHNATFQAVNVGLGAYQINQSLPGIGFQPQPILSPGLAIKPQALLSPNFTPLQAQQSLPSPGLLSPGLLPAAHAMSVSSAVNTTTSEPRGPFGSMQDNRLTPSQPPPLQRHGSTPGMDTLADLASMQHHQQTSQQNGSGLRTSSVSYTTNHALRRSISARTVAEITMADAPPVFKAKSLSDQDLQTLSDLEVKLASKPDDYESLVQRITILHKGFYDYVNGDDEPSPHSYELLKELRDARHAMEDKYPVGEELWVEWISDEKVLANSVDARLSLMELCSKAVEDEPNSAQLWKIYGDYMYYLWDASSNEDDTSDGWSEEDKMIGKEVFTWDAMLGIWQRGVAATQWHLNDSNIVWDHYVQILAEDQLRHSSPEKITQLRSLFESRLLQPHATWDQTFQAFSQLISKYEPDSYEEVMVQTNQRCVSAKNQYSLRETHENNIQQAASRGDKDAEWAAYTAYLDWELQRKGVFSFHLINALYERATLRFSTDATLWEDYVELLVQYSDAAVPVLPVLIRATRHCPWSGDLWAQYLLTLEAEGRDFHELEHVKHRATRTGILDSGGMEELIKVYIAWCGYLRRRAFVPGATEDELDVAEVGIRSALEHVKEIGEERYGKEYKGDPRYRLERIHIKFLTQAGNIEAARDVYRSLIPLRGNSYDFWQRFYFWEMVMWGRYARSPNNQQPLPTPHAATLVLLQGLKYTEKMDWPETLIEIFLNHIEQHESIQELRVGMIQVRKASKEVAKRRAREQAEAAQAYVQQQQEQQAAEVTVEDYGSGKRKWEGNEEEHVAKKTKQDEGTAELASEAPQQEHDSSAVVSQVKRDRENSTIVVRNIPLDAPEAKIRQFFRDCGTMLSIKLSPEQDGESQKAIIEFETQEDAQFALARDGRDFAGNEINVSLGTGSVLWVCNYPPAADEQYIKDLFKEYGEIIEVRFPSLALNTHRRFCYVQFASAEQAEAATQMDGRKLEDKFDLMAKVSNPAIKQHRRGALDEGREVYLGNVHWHANEQAVRELCRKYGKVERVRIPKQVNGKSKGAAFVSFTTKEGAEKAVEGLEGTSFMDRALRVSISKPQAGMKMDRAIYSSATPEPSGENKSRRGSIANGKDDSPAAESGPSARERTITLIGVPDTVNTARIAELMKRYGEVRKVINRPDHQGALVEFADITGLGKAELALTNGLEIAPGRTVRAGTYGQMRAMTRERKSDKLTTAPKKKDNDTKTQDDKKSAPAMPFGGTHISRPAQRSGRRGGLGYKGHGGLGGARAKTTGSGETKDVEMTGSTTGVNGSKSNADFKAMFLRGKEGNTSGGGES